MLTTAPPLLLIYLTSINIAEITEDQQQSGSAAASLHLALVT